MGDLISRQDAIDVADAVWSVTGDKNVAKVWDQIKDLPSAQPEKMQLSREDATFDCISRQAAIDAMCDACSDWCDEGVCKKVSAIQKLSSAQPEIIRCKDCKYFERDIQRSWGTYNGCGVWTDDGNETEVKLDDFCSYAERRGE